MRKKSNGTHSYIYENQLWNTSRIGHFELRELPPFIIESAYRCLNCGFNPFYPVAMEECPFCTRNEFSYTLSCYSCDVGVLILKMIYEADNRTTLLFNNNDRYSVLPKCDKSLDELLNNEQYAKDLVCKALDYNYAACIRRYRDKKKFLKASDLILKLKNQVQEKTLDIFDFYYNEYSAFKKLCRKIKGDLLGMRRLKRIEAQGLFGYYSFSLNFHNGNCSIVIGPNGLGKTTIFKIMSILFKEPNNLNEIKKVLSVPFKEMTFLFFDDSSIKVLKPAGNEMTIEYCRRGNVAFDFPPVSFKNNCSQIEFKESADRHYQNMLQILPRLNLGNSFLSIDITRKPLQAIDNTLESINYFQEYLDDFHRKEQYISSSIETHFQGKPILYLTQKDYDIFSLLMKNDFFSKSEIDSINQLEIRVDENCVFNPWNLNIENELDELDPGYWLSSSDVSDMLNLSKQIYDRIHILSDAFASLYDYEGNSRISDPAKKTLKFINGKLFAESETLKTRIPLEKLSSGERNALLILFDIVFHSDDGSIVLVDEPELSLHIAWQQRLGKIIQRIIKNKKGIQVIMATHSPFISASNPDLLVEARLLQERG